MEPAQTTKTRSGRLVKPPIRYEPTEQVEDDYSSDEYDSDGDEDDEDIYSSDDESDTDDDDSEGSLRDFVVPDSESESESES